MLHVRPFARHDRDGLAQLVNVHVAAAMPGGAIPTARLLGHLERDTDEYVVDPWVIGRHTLVAIDRDRVVAAAHLLRYGRGEHVGDDYDDAGEIAWVICWPDQVDTGRALIDAALDRLRAWGCRVWYAAGNLPCPGVYGVPDAWPHVGELLDEAGFAPSRVEVIFAGELAGVSQPGDRPNPDVSIRRRVGALGTRFDAEVGGTTVGSFEVDTSLSKGGAQRSMETWADVADHWVSESHRGQGIGSWLFRHGCAWLRLGGTERLLAYADGDEAAAAARYVERLGLVEIGRSQRGWSRLPD